MRPNNNKPVASFSSCGNYEIIHFITHYQRNNSFKKQFANSYNIDFTKEENYDLVLSADNKTPNKLADIIISHLYKSAS